jgi:uncharacterized membrane protein
LEINIDTSIIEDHKKTSKRLFFIDLMRAYAILMMVQGHAIDATIAPQYRLASDFFYDTWNHMRGVTAPVFFFSSGAIFTYLLLRKDMPFWQNERVIKGLKRAGLLLLTGYILRINPDMFTNLSNFDYLTYSTSFACDALHCIAFGLFTLIAGYGIFKLTKIPVWFIYGLLGSITFILYPTFWNMDILKILPFPIACYFTPNYGSNFPLFPWMGFVLWGGLFGYILSKSAGISFNQKFSLVVLVIGITIALLSGPILGLLFQITGYDNFANLQYNNFQFLHLGTILILCGILSLYANYFPIPLIIAKVGQSTMMIYIVHIFIIYGTGISNGLMYWFGGSFVPWQSILTALLIIAFFLIFLNYSERLKNIFINFRQKLFAGNKYLQ